MFISKLFPNKKFKFNTSTNGSHRTIVPIGSYEEVMPLDIQATFLARALLSNDVERAEELGVLELSEEDVALMTYSCPGKNDFGLALREMLMRIEKENS